MNAQKIRKEKPEGATHWSKLNGMYYKDENKETFYFDDEWNLSRVVDLNTDYFLVL